MQDIPKVLTIAGSDSGGGAGIQADLKTFAALGCYGTSAITAITAQNTLGVDAIHPVPAEMVAQQIRSVLDDIGADAVKIGMLQNEDIVRVLARELKAHTMSNVVLDPVLLSTSGRELLHKDAILVMQEQLFPLVDLLTPNIPETEFLLDLKIEDLDGMRKAAKALTELGPTAVLLKGGHMVGEDAIDVLYDAQTKQWMEFSSPMIATRNSHGTGCTLSSAIAAHLAKGLTLADAVGEAKNYLKACLLAGAAYSIGKGHGPLCHFH